MAEGRYAELEPPANLGQPFTARYVRAGTFCAASVPDAVREVFGIEREPGEEG